MRIRSEALSISKSSWFYVPEPKDNPRLRLFCFPYAGGNAEIYHSWTEGLPADIELCAIQYPGHSARRNEAPLTEFSILLEELYYAIKPFLDRPCVFFGHSLGVMLSFELTQFLYKQEMNLPSCLFLSGHEAPHIYKKSYSIHKMTIKEFITLVRPYNVIPEEVLDNQKLMREIMPIIKADFEVVESWKEKDSYLTLPMPILVLRSANDNLVSQKEIEAWRSYTQNKFKILVFPGNHFYILKPNIRKTILHLITESLSDIE